MSGLITPEAGRRLCHLRLASLTGRVSRFWVGVVCLALLGCTNWGPQEPSMGGWPLGVELPCEAIVLDAVPDSADLEDPAARVVCYSEGSYLRNDQPIHLNRSGGVTIVVVTSKDGSKRAVGIYCSARCGPVAPPPAQ